MVNQSASESASSPFTQEVAKRLRGRLAEQRIRQTEVMVGCRWSKTTAYRKMNGYSPLDTDEMERLWAAFGISPVFLLTGDHDDRPYPDPSRGADQVSEMSPVRTREGAPTRPALRLVVTE